jgi:hypothetical protein
MAKASKSKPGGVRRLPPKPVGVGRLPFKLDGVSRLLARCEAAYRAGEPLAAYEAFLLCCRHQVPPPAWLEPAIGAAFVAYRKGTPKDSFRYRKRREYYVHWEMMRDLIQAGLTWDAAKVEAARRLKGTPLQAEPDTIRKHHDLVQEDFKHGHMAKYFSPSDKRFSELDFNVVPRRHREPRKRR